MRWWLSKMQGLSGALLLPQDSFRGQLKEHSMQFAVQPKLFPLHKAANTHTHTQTNSRATETTAITDDDGRQKQQQEYTNTTKSLQDENYSPEWCCEFISLCDKTARSLGRLFKNSLWAWIIRKKITRADDEQQQRKKM